MSKIGFEFEVDGRDLDSISEVPTEVLVTFVMDIITELEERLNRKEELRAVN